MPVSWQGDEAANPWEKILLTTHVTPTVEIDDQWQIARVLPRSVDAYWDDWRAVCSRDLLVDCSALAS